MVVQVYQSLSNSTLVRSVLQGVGSRTVYGAGVEASAMHGKKVVGKGSAWQERGNVGRICLWWISRGPHGRDRPLDVETACSRQVSNA